MTTKERLSELRNSFYEHDSTRNLSIYLVCVEPGFALVSIKVTKDMLVNSDIEPGRVVQGGFIGGVLADFAAVYAAMTLSSGHALLTEFNFKFQNKTVLGEILFAEAYAAREGRRVDVSCKIENVSGETKGEGNFTFLLAKNEEE